MKRGSAILDRLKFDERDLIPAIIQDHSTGEVLMFAYMNRDSVLKTLEGPYTTFWSRSRKKLWIKGEESGHTQEVKEMRVDCDQDALLIRVDQKVAACHEGYRSCFFKKIEGENLKISSKKVFEPTEVYKK